MRGHYLSVFNTLPVYFVDGAVYNLHYPNTTNSLDVDLAYFSVYKSGSRLCYQ
jgi:selenocysteine lyase/cysteine desulfurase